jgi:UDP-GlcNAc3NAcA epimerase
MSHKILSIVGARPQFIKAAPVSKDLAVRRGLVEVMVHTGQHFDGNMSKVFFDELELPTPAYELGIHGGTHGEMTGRMLIALEAVMLSERPEIVLLYGDTNSTLAGALSAAKLHIPVAHVEAGLRSFNEIPEEMNRRITDHLSRWLFCPTPAAIDNLAREGVTRGVHLVGDVGYDAMLMTRERARTSSTILARQGLTAAQFQLATLHRAENTESREALARAVRYLDEEARQGPVILPLHPRTRAAIAHFEVELGRIRAIEPVSYVDMAALLDGCTRVLTDSGGLQKEAYFFRKPCVTLRDTTEWRETIEAGWNRLWTEAAYQPRREIEAYGNGHAAREIVSIIAANCNLPGEPGAS